jgi:hypothetical protein
VKWKPIQNIELHNFADRYLTREEPMDGTGIGATHGGEAQSLCIFHPIADHHIRIDAFLVPISFCYVLPPQT